MLMLESTKNELADEANQSGDIFRFEEISEKTVALDLYPTDETSKGEGFLYLTRYKI